MKTQFTLHGIMSICILTFVLFCLLGCSEKVEVEQVSWSASERCMIIHGKPCSCVGMPTEEWQQVFKCGQ